MSSNAGMMVDADIGDAEGGNVCPTCVRCKKLITSGHAYELGDDRWHTHCFSCYRCEKALSCHSDFLVLGTGTLICFDCSDCCKSCGKKIDNLAIILSSSNEAYCSECFKCCKCGDNIKDLRYAKTKRGLFCIHCHEKLLAKRKYYEEKKRRLKKDLPEVPAADHTIPLVIPEKSSRRPLSPTKGQGQFSQSPPKSMIKSNSGSVISQYLNENDAEKKNEQEQETRQSKHSRNVSIDDILNSTLENDEHDLRVVQEPKLLLDKTPLRNHKATDSISRSPMSHRQGMVLESDSPPADLAETVENSLTGLQGQIQLGGGSVKDNMQAAPILSRSDEAFNEGHANTHGLAITLPSPELTVTAFKNEEDTLTLGLQENTPTTNSLPSPPSSPSPIKLNEAASSVSKNTGPPDNTLIPPASGGNAAQETNTTHGRSGKKIGRSLSRKSKNLVHSLKSKTTGILDPRSASPSNPSGDALSPPSSSGSVANTSPKTGSDTHSGWGVSAFEDNGISPTSAVFSRHRTTPRGKSDSTLHSEQRPGNKIGKRSITEALDHRRAHSNASVSSVSTNVSMFRTPPLENSSVFGRVSNSGSISHRRTISRQANNETVIEEPVGLDLANGGLMRTDAEDESTFTKELAETELLLRKLKSEVNELESKRAHLVHEIDKLQSSKDKLCYEVERLVGEKSKYASMESLNPTQRSNEMLRSQDGSSDAPAPAKLTETASVARPATKPRFWKIFSGARQQPWQAQPQQQQGTTTANGLAADTSVSSSSSFPSTGNAASSRLEISGPVLQNPNEFSDMKLVPISNNSRSEVSMQSSPSRLEGSILYGSSLVARCNYEQSAIPIIIKTCVQHIENDDSLLASEGIYRKSGSQLLIEEIERAFTDCERSPSNELLNLLNEDVHAVASVLKRYLRKLPNPLLTFQIYEPLINVVRENRLMINVPLKAASDAGSNDPQYVAALNIITKILDNLPKEHLDVLQYLAKHVDKVTSYNESNLMTLHNLSLVFAPGLIRDYSGDKDIPDMKERNYIVGFIFGHYRDIFHVA
ncbi:hypothetical protein HG536_0F02620 [Torulaspora globosa]|uniref:Rho-GAP domain-containing protein n=1 Tax=Torulaspora globosa TaxID=48254 RepID=A0A7G3ZKA1_9SACH|nr:uncharacterized protein HG536_0F02620 [Torulaspora globosa]QLL33937.1 hypothetical protein HG536_0F02620 [Torulaspora globosa]